MFCLIILGIWDDFKCTGPKWNDALEIDIFWFKYDLDRSITHPKFDWTRVRTHDLQIMESTVHVNEKLVLTTKPSGTSPIRHETVEEKAHTLLTSSLSIPQIQSFNPICIPSLLIFHASAQVNLADVKYCSDHQLWNICQILRYLLIKVAVTIMCKFSMHTHTHVRTHEDVLYIQFVKNNLNDTVY